VDSAKDLRKVDARPTARGVRKLEQRFRAVLEPRNQILLDCALPWHTSPDVSLEAAIAVYQKYSSKKMLGTLKSRDCYMVLLVTCIEMLTGDPHYEDVAQMMKAAAVASGTTNIPLILDGHWVEVTVGRFKEKFSNFERVISRLAASYVKKICGQD
jgi:hypothetical protein